ncbi:hypothetical protein PRZ48_012815 [Zasmidium cellare]|uniref:ABM domain-containing protein n=1 Tax=Zasmidium cellare TaxID=395010 RepID=A0ABR0E5Y3_ZASCE|nr:hypothetical protein PRZ48_012815 [Zasmidium cellare]
MSSTEINIVAVLHPKQGSVDEVITIFSDLAKWIHANEPGTLVYQVHRSLRPGKDGNEDVVIVERYKDAAALKTHGSTPQFKSMQATFAKKKLMRAAPEIHTVSGKGGFASRL